MKRKTLTTYLTSCVLIGTMLMTSACAGKTTDGSVAASEAEETTEVTETELPPVDLSEAAAEPLPDELYTGSEIYVAPVLTYEDREFSLDDFTVEYDNNINLGTCTVTVTGNGDTCVGQTELTFNIITGDEVCDAEENAALDAFVDRLYVHFLGRYPTLEEMTDNVHRLRSGSRSGMEIVNMIILSPEFEARGLDEVGFVQAFYLGVLNRNPDEDGLWYNVNLLWNGMSRTDLVNGIMDVPGGEFDNLCNSLGITLGNGHITGAAPIINDGVPSSNFNYTVDGRTLNPYKSTSGYEFRTAPYLCANYGDYNPNIPPKVGIYTIKLEGEAVPTSEDKVYNVVLDWTSSLDEMSGGTVGQDFILYIVVKDENGVDNVEEILTTTETSYTYPVPQNEHSYTLTYVVYGQPNDGEHDMFVAWSNEADVVIPGWNDFLSLSLNHVESDYKVNQELNYYRNFLNVGNEDAVNALTPARVNAGENSFTLYRFDAAYPTVLTPVANLTLTANIYRAHYDISYMNQEPLPGFNFNIKTSGSLTVGDNDAIDMGDILFVDQFTASTALNDHPSQYGYVLKLNNADTDKGTNTVDVYVYKTAAKLGGFYTEEEVLDDTEPALTPGVINANVGMNLNGNINVYYYTMQRGYNSLPNVEIMDLQHNTNNTYIETCDDLGMEGTVYAVGPMDILDTDVITGEGDAYMSYLPVIWTFGDDRVDRAQNPLIDNSYGSEIMKTGVTDLDVVVTGTRSDNKFSNWKDENDETCSIYNPVITVTAELPTEASIEYEPYMVRVWRDCDQIRNSVINENGHRANDWWSPRPAHLLIVEELTDETEFTLGSLATNALAFGATNSANISFVVRYYYKAVNPAKADADAPMYYVVEKTIEWTDITTSINEINASVEVSKTYYNAQGVQSDKPFDGVNIVVTTFSDGSTKTAKVVR